LATRTTRSSSKKAPAAVETSESIAEQTALFLKSGNKIDVIESGVSGQSSLPSGKHIKLGNNKRA
jgi:SutA RNAP-binding domain